VAENAAAEEVPSSSNGSLATAVATSASDGDTPGITLASVANGNANATAVEHEPAAVSTSGSQAAAAGLEPELKTVAAASPPMSPAELHEAGRSIFDQMQVLLGDLCILSGCLVCYARPW